MEENLLLKEIQNGNPNSFKKLFALYYIDLVQYAHHYLYDKSNCEDIVQEVFIYIWEHPDLKIEKSLKSYLYMMVRNRCYNFLKQIKITDDVKLLELTTTLMVDADLDVFNEEDKKSTYNNIMQIIEKMPLQMQQVFTEAVN